MEETTEQVII